MRGIEGCGGLCQTAGSEQHSVMAYHSPQLQAKPKAARQTASLSSDSRATTMVLATHRLSGNNMSQAKADMTKICAYITTDLVDFASTSVL